MLVKVLRAVCVLGPFTAGLWAGDFPFEGTWKLNPSKSNWAGPVKKFVEKAPGEYLITDGGLSFTVKADGKEYPGPAKGLTATLRKIDSRTWETTGRLNGKVAGTSRLEIARDGMSMTEVSIVQMPSGGEGRDVIRYERVEGEGTELAGSWRTAKLDSGTPSSFTIRPYGLNGMVWESPEWKASMKAPFDGKDYPVKGEMMPAGVTLSHRRTGPRQIHWVQKVEGKPVGEGTITVSPDGRTLTFSAHLPNSPGTVTEVYDRQ